ncbi:HEXXH motif-containing putative peptide modification protein [Streptomyces sp. 7-21]|uniref:aKG-HExxH-type peptide beta-hydroxylase n=1 Tax=Streptomyces sp. 7-21 TaxID=2802283 RepID=UPI00191CD586|nr:HEXXH motif-containing putative peptide modification protein [Streptomyces sp. 7-21]MBL1065116.1 hypothetical protein [Streptomyces sp. 7-21]
MSAAVPGPALTAEQLRRLGQAESDRPTLETLTAAQHTKRLLLLRLLFDALPAAGDGTAGALAREHADLLVAAERADPERARPALFYPLVGPWLEAWLRRGADAEARAGLGGLAVAAAARTGLRFTTRVPVAGGYLTLPALGGLWVGRPATVTARGDGERLVLRGDDGEAVTLVRSADGSGAWRADDARWLPLRPLPGGPGTVYLDHAAPPALTGERQRPLSPEGHVAAEHARWAALWRGALPLLRAAGPQRYAALRLLTCVVPLRAGRAGDHKAGTSPQSFGAVMMRRPAGPQALAETLTHEVQHAKLGALSDLAPLHEADDRARFWAPWRPDPRPFDGLLHGVYAHLELADFWHRLAAADAAGREQAWQRHARYWAMVDAALPQVRHEDRLTDAGQIFVGALVERHAGLGETPVPARHRAEAAEFVARVRAAWPGPAPGTSAPGPGRAPRTSRNGRRP